MLFGGAAKKRQAFIIVYIIFLALLAVNVAGCTLMAPDYFMDALSGIN